MSYIFPILPSRETKEKSFAFWQGGFNHTELDKIVTLCDEFPKEQAKTYSSETEGPELERIRNSIIAWIHPNEKTSWFFERIANYSREINEKYFGFDLWGLADGLQYTIYDSSVQGHYDWHIDSSLPGFPQRKLSFVIQLSDPMDYEGGELWIHGSRKLIMSKERGIIHYFPSYTLHRVTPVTSGRRMSLVGWINGPEFR